MKPSLQRSDNVSAREPSTSSRAWWGFRATLTAWYVATLALLLLSS